MNSGYSLGGVRVRLLLCCHNRPARRLQLNHHVGRFLVFSVFFFVF